MAYICSSCANEDFSNLKNLVPHVNCTTCGKRTICKKYLLDSRGTRGKVKSIVPVYIVNKAYRIEFDDGKFYMYLANNRRKLLNTTKVKLLANWILNNIEEFEGM